MIIRGGRIHDGNGRIYESDILVKVLAVVLLSF